MEKKTKKKNGTARFRFAPLLFLLLPIALLIFPIFVGFKDPEYVYVAVIHGQGISAVVSLYRCFTLSGGTPNAFFWIGLGSAIALGLFGTSAAFFPKLCEGKVMAIAGFVGFGGCAFGMIIGHCLLAATVERVSAEYIESVGRIVDPTSGYSHATIFFYLEMLLPAVLLVWWGVVMLLNFKARKKEKENPVSESEESLPESQGGSEEN